MHAAVANGGGI